MKGAIPLSHGSLLCISLLSSGLHAKSMHFVDVTVAANILHKHSHENVDNFIHMDHALMSGGAVAEDFDGDGWIDLYVLQGGDSPNLLYMNQKDGSFKDEATARGADLTGLQMGTCAADYDNDGDIDIFISAITPPHHLLINDGTGSFTIDSSQIFLPAVGATSPSWGDLDNDGLLELALGQWFIPKEDYLHIYRTNEGGQLYPYAALPNSWDFIPRFLDMDGDHMQDLLVVSDFGKTRWFRNYGNSQLLQAGTSDIDNGMGAAIGDIDNDGDLDIFMTSILGWDPSFVGESYTTGNRLLLNDGLGNYEDITDEAGVRDGAWGWGAEMADFDNDGDLDIYHVNGWGRDFPTGTFANLGNTPARLFENIGDSRFQEIAAESGDAANTGQGRCAIAFDFDNDGDLDIFIANNSVPEGIGEPYTYKPGSPVLLRNETINTNNYLDVKLKGAGAPHHSHGIGARVYLSTGEKEQMRELHASSGFNGHGPGRISHFGLGTSQLADRIQAIWTNGDQTEIRNVTANQTIIISSPVASVSMRQIHPGEQILANFPIEELPEGASAIWTAEGVDYANPAHISLEQPGIYDLQVTITSGEGAFLWSEGLQVSVASLETDRRSTARVWNEQNLAAIRTDFPDPTKHARNLFATSIAMWDAWAAYDHQATGVLYNEAATANDPQSARQEAISYAAYRVLSERYKNSVNASITGIALTSQMLALEYDPSNTGIEGDSPAAVGNRVAAAVLSYTSSDGWDQPDYYEPVNDPLPVAERGTIMNDPNRWQPLLFEEAFTQNQQTADLIQEYLGPNWGWVRPFALPSFEGGQLLHLDPGPPPQLGGETDAAFKEGNLSVISYSNQLDPGQTELIDISPGAYGNNSLGLNDGHGYGVNPITGESYTPNIVRKADFYRVIAEYWADGPDSETPPGHWNKLANNLHEHPAFIRRFGATDSELDPLEWDVKLYLALNGALHDAAIVAWGCKRFYDFVRPVSSIRYMGGMGQSSDAGRPSYHPHGLPLAPGLVEVITQDSSQTGHRHAHLAGNVESVAINTWFAGENGQPGKVDWILAENWLPYQRDTFVTPAFPGYVSGHSTFSRSAAEVLALMTGSIFFPGGMGTFTAKQNEFLEFEAGPTSDVVLQWATYYDAADQAGVSRLYGGIHVPADDGPGRVIGSIVGINAWELALQYFDGSIRDEPLLVQIEQADSSNTGLSWNTTRGGFYLLQEASYPEENSFQNVTDWIWAGETREYFELPAPGDVPRFFRVLRKQN